MNRKINPFSKKVSQERRGTAIYPCLPWQGLTEISHLQAGQEAKRAQKAGECGDVWETNFWTLRHLLGLTSHISLWCLIQLCEFIRIVFHPVPKRLQIMQNIFTFQSLKILFLNYVFKRREILLLLLITRQFLQNIYALKGCTNLYFTANYWSATIPKLEKVCK